MPNGGLEEEVATNAYSLQVLYDAGVGNFGLRQRRLEGPTYQPS